MELVVTHEKNTNMLVTAAVLGWQGGGLTPLFNLKLQ